MQMAQPFLLRSEPNQLVTTSSDFCALQKKIRPFNHRVASIQPLLLRGKHHLGPLALVDAFPPSNQRTRHVRLFARPIFVPFLLDLLARPLPSLVQFRLVLGLFSVDVGGEALFTGVATAAAPTHRPRHVPFSRHAHLLALQFTVLRIILRVGFGDEVLGQGPSGTGSSSAWVRGPAVLRRDVVALPVVDDPGVLAVGRVGARGGLFGRRLGRRVTRLVEARLLGGL